MNNWLKVLERLNDILDDFQAKIETAEATLVIEDEVKFTVCCILKFISVLFRSAEDKRFFMNFEVYLLYINMVFRLKINIMFRDVKYF
jgi:hypothetical protein